MSKLVNYFAGALVAVVIFCNETMSPMQLLCTAILTAALLWLSARLNLEFKMHKFDVAGAPIASAVARDLNIDVKPTLGGYSVAELQAIWDADKATNDSWLEGILAENTKDPIIKGFED